MKYYRKQKAFNNIIKASKIHDYHGNFVTISNE